MRLWVFLLALLVGPALAAAEPPKKKQKQLAHKKPTPEQIRKFNELEKKKR